MINLGKLHSLTLDPATKAEDEMAISTTNPGEVVYINPPLSVNVELISEFHRNAIPLWPDNCSLAVNDKLVIPISGENGFTSTDIKFENSKILKFNCYPFDLRFAITFHKAQGQTMEKIILDVRKRPKLLGKLMFQSFYVGMSRVRKGDDIRIMPFYSEDTISFLKQLKPDDAISAWISKYKPTISNSFIKKYE